MSNVVEGDGPETISGFICNDSAGLCLEARGTADARVAGFFTSILRRATSLAPSATETPTVLIETKEHNIVVRDYDDLTLAVFQKIH